MYVTDTHSFLWHLQNDGKLSNKAKSVFDACDNENEVIIIPSITLIESIFICEKKKIEMKFQQIIEKLKNASNYYVYPLDEEVACECSKINLREPHDRIIVATSKLIGAPLITNDEDIKKSKLAQIIW
ncbi:MAG: PIN domain-containing protein [Candidatus Aenigmarchaeota archaeon]|nr:PIN domain-containing protein [Candidatus Aenigmarchaeota archaeon]